MNILVLGVNGMAGSAIFNYLSNNTKDIIYGTTRTNTVQKNNIIYDIDAKDLQKIDGIIKTKNINCIINCIGLIKQKKDISYIEYIKINSIFPHQLASICERNNTRLIHISTDCVFDGMVGDYRETDKVTANDIYGQSKYCGELDYDHTVTIRTSIIGQEISTNHGLVEWFLSREKSVLGYTNAIYSGFPTVILAEILHKHLINNSIHGLYHVSSEPISKYDLLVLISKIFDKKILIEPYSNFYCNRSLNSDKFKKETGFISKDWESMILTMKEMWR